MYIILGFRVGREPDALPSAKSQVTIDFLGNTGTDPHLNEGPFFLEGGSHDPL